MVKIVRLVGFGVTAAAAVLALVLLGPDGARRYQPIAVEGNLELIDAAFQEYESNSTNAGDDLALQAVVNGWVARDLLYIVANELDSISAQLSVISAQSDGVAAGSDADDRVPALLLIGVVAFAFHAATLHYVEPAVAGSRRSSAGRSVDEDLGFDDDENDENDEEYDYYDEDDSDDV